MADGSGNTTSSKPKWLRSTIQSNRPNRRNPARPPRRVSSASAARTLPENHEHTGTSIGPASTSTIPQPPQYEFDPPSTSTSAQVVSASASAPPFLTDELPAASVAKRKAPGAAPGDEERRGRLRPVGALGKSRKKGADAMFISNDEGLRIMTESTTAVDLARCATASTSGKVHGKRTRKASATSDDGKVFPHPPSPYACLSYS
jgi:hypothetical protein